MAPWTYRGAGSATLCATRARTSPSSASSGARCFWARGRAGARSVARVAASGCRRSSAGPQCPAHTHPRREACPIVALRLDARAPPIALVAEDDDLTMCALSTVRAISPASSPGAGACRSRPEVIRSHFKARRRESTQRRCDPDYGSGAPVSTRFASSPIDGPGGPSATLHGVSARDALSAQSGERARRALSTRGRRIVRRSTEDERWRSRPSARAPRKRAARGAPREARRARRTARGAPGSRGVRRGDGGGGGPARAARGRGRRGARGRRAVVTEERAATAARARGRGWESAAREQVRRGLLGRAPRARSRCRKSWPTVAAYAASLRPGVYEAALPARTARFAYTVGDAFAARVRAGDELQSWLRGIAPRWCAANDAPDDAVRRARGADLAREFVERSRVVFATTRHARRRRPRGVRPRGARAPRRGAPPRAWPRPRRRGSARRSARRQPAGRAVARRRGRVC